MGEFNVNKSDGSLEQTAGMPETYPAEQVMMSDGVTSVEEALDAALRMEKGSESKTISQQGNTYTAITFGTSFNSVPAVMATLNADGTMGDTACGVRNVTVSGFDLYFRNNGTSSVDVKVDWLAIGN